MAENIIKDLPEIGDIVVIINGRKKFIRGAEATKEYIDTLQAVGVVYDIQGSLVRIVGGKNTTSKQLSAVADYEITAIPAVSGDYAVALCGVAQGSFTYTKVDGTVKEFCRQLDAWLKAQPASSKAAKWESYYNDETGKGYLQMWNYNEYESTNTIASTTLSKLIGTELEPYTTSTGARNSVKQYITYNGICYQRLLERARTDTTAGFNPTTRMNGTTQLFETYPVSEIYYNGELGDGLRRNFPTYEDYILACMCEPRDLNKGMMQYRDGKLMTGLLKDKKVIRQGTETFAYPAARFALEYDAEVDGLRAGDWWLPSMYELKKLMHDITVGTTKPADKVNVALAKKTGWSKIDSTSYRWSSSRCSANSAWSYVSIGITYNYYYSVSLPCSVVSAFKIEN